jgi:V/A-type H+-transporting ATPase subunit K
VVVGVKVGLIAIGAALAIGLSAIATGLAQSRIGAAMAGAIAERPELVGSAIILVAIPETMVILGFVVAFLITALKSTVK